MRAAGWGWEISIHAPREGSDHYRNAPSEVTRTDFNPRSPRGERRGKGDREAQDGEFQSTLPARGATRDIARQDTVQGISIHAPREGSDCWHLSPAERSKANFNPRSPRGERPTRLALARSMSPFQSTLPARGATVHDARQPPPGLYFNPRSPRGERLDIIAYQPAPLGISIHAPREGSDQLPCRMAQADRDFNPRSPRGERLGRSILSSQSKRFQSTLPARGATVSLGFAPSSLAISIHAPREGSDIDINCDNWFYFLFQSTLPARGATSFTNS